MNTSVLRKVVMLVVLFAGYVSVMGACCGKRVLCEECFGVPDYVVCDGDTGYCLKGNCVSGSP